MSLHKRSQDCYSWLVSSAWSSGAKTWRQHQAIERYQSVAPVLRDLVKPQTPTRPPLQTLGQLLCGLAELFLNSAPAESS